MPVGENAEDRARKAINAQDPKKGQEMQQVQALQSSIQEIQGERTNNLQAARMGAEGDARETQAMIQAAELATIGGAAGGAGVAIENATPIQQTSPQTQALLSKYGVGKPRNQTTTTRSVQQTPTKITINNNTTNNTTNNVAVPAANIGGPVQGRTLAIKQQPDPGQARFKTWISNAFARQNQAAAQREKEYQRREWSLSRTTGKLMKKLQELGTTISERMDPRRMASSVSGHLKTLLFLFGTMFLAKNWEKVLEIGKNIEYFFLGAPGEGGGKGRGKSTLSKTLIKLFGGNPEDKKTTVGTAFRDIFWNDKKNGVFQLFAEEIKAFFKLRGEAVKAIKFPELDLTDTIGSIKGVAEYLGNILKVFLGGPEAAKEVVRDEIRSTGTAASMDSEAKWANKMTYTDKATGTTADGKKLKDTSLGDAAIIAGGKGKSQNFLNPWDISDDGKQLTSSAAGVRQSNAISSMLESGDETVHSSAVMTGFNMLENTAKEQGSTVIGEDFFDSLRNLGIDTSSLLNNENLVKKEDFKFVKRSKDDADLRREGADWRTEAAKEGGEAWVESQIPGLNDAKTIATTVTSAIGGSIIPTIGTLMGGTVGYIGAKLHQSPAVRATIGAAKGKWNEFLAEGNTLEMVPYSGEGDPVKLEVKVPNGANFYNPKLTDYKTVEKDKFTFYKVTPEFFQRLRSLIGQKLNKQDFSFDTADESSIRGLDKLLTDYKKKKIQQTNAYNSKELISNLKSDVDYTKFDRLRELETKEKEVREELNKKWEEAPITKVGQNLSEVGSKVVNKVEGVFTRESNIPLRAPEKLTEGEYRDRVIKTMEFAMKELGMTKEQAAGLAGNFMRESSMITTAKNPSPSAATGLAQWLGVRKAAFEHSRDLTEKEKEAGWKYYDGPGSGKPLANASFEEQLRFVKWEMENIPAYIKGLKKIKESKDEKEAAANVFGYYEFSAGPQGAVKAMNESNQDGLGSLNKGINFAGDALLAYNTLKGGKQETPQEDTTTQPDASGTYITQNTLEQPKVTDYGIEFNGQTYNPEYAQNLMGGLDSKTGIWDWNKGGDALTMAMADLPKVTPDTATPVNSGNSNPITVSSTEKTARDITTNNDTDLIAGDISQKITQVVENLKVVHSGQLAQIEATTNLANSIAGIKINVGQGGNGPLQPTVQSWSAPCYSESNG